MFEIEEFIRIGKVAGESRNFGVRGEEHRKGTTLTQPNPTLLYYKYHTEVMQVLHLSRRLAILRI